MHLTILLLACDMQWMMLCAAEASTFFVEQYLGYIDGSPTLAEMSGYARNTAADRSALVDIIDFTDDPKGFAGNIKGSNPWPAVAATANTGKGGSNNYFMAHTTATLTVSAGDIFTFRTFNDDGLVLLVGGDVVIEDLTFHPEREFSGTKTLDQGSYALEIFFFEHAGEASLEFSMAGSKGLFTHDGGASFRTCLPYPCPQACLR